MRILHLTTFLQGGAGLAIAELAGGQTALGHDVVVVTSETGAAGYGNYPAHLDRLEQAGVRTCAVDSLFARELPQNLNVVRVLKEIAGRRGFDIIHAHAATPSLIGMIFAGRGPESAPVLQTMHGWGISKSAAQQSADIAVLNTIDRIVVPADTSAALLRDLGVTSPIGVVPYGLGPRRQASTATDETIDEMRRWRAAGGTVFCCVGTIGPRKNQRFAVDALRLLAEHERVLFVFVGDGDADDLRRYARAAGVAAAVRVVGYRDNADVFLDAADAFVLPSLSEGQPLAILEAWRAGLPVVVSDIPELAELVDDGSTGFVFDPRDPAALAATLRVVASMTSASRNALAARVRRRYETRFTVDAMVAGYLNEYAALSSACGRG